MLSYFFHRGLVVTINSDNDTTARQRAYEIAAERIAVFNEEPRLIGHATLPVDGVVVTWDHTDQLVVSNVLARQAQEPDVFTDKMEFWENVGKSFGAQSVWSMYDEAGKNPDGIGIYGTNLRLTYLTRSIDLPDSPTWRQQQLKRQ